MKQCVKCKVEKGLDGFRKRKNSKDGYNNTCSECQSGYQKNHYKENKTLYVEKAAKWRNKEKSKFLEFLGKQCCIDCGECNPIVLEFDHRYDKEFDIAKKVGVITFEKLIEEIKKCDIRCANCHRIKTAKDFGWRKCLQSF